MFWWFMLIFVDMCMELCGVLVKVRVILWSCFLLSLVSFVVCGNGNCVMKVCSLFRLVLCLFVSGLKFCLMLIM